MSLSPSRHHQTSSAVMYRGHDAVDATDVFTPEPGSIAGSLSIVLGHGKSLPSGVIRELAIGADVRLFGYDDLAHIPDRTPVGLGKLTVHGSAPING